MQSSQFLMLLLYLSVPAAAAAGEDRVWVIGGGPNVLESQVQIERNVLWALEALHSLPGKRKARVFFTDGEEATPDVHEWSLPPETAAALQPLARVFDAYWRNGLRYRNHRIPHVAGTTEADRLVAALGADLRALEPGERGWLLFIGHGTQSEDLDNRLELWSGTHLSVSEVQALLDEALRESRLRFLFTQCYSGAFAKLATPDRDRCGFLAAAPDRVSEGCSAAIEKTDYEDFSTYSFAALTGRPRNHAGLNGRPDWDSDGRVTPLEAHFHVLVNAFSADTPTATSEVLLMDRQPGELPDLLTDGNKDENEYTTMAFEMMRRNGIDPDEHPGREMHQRQQQLQGQWERLSQDQERLHKEIVELEEGLETQLLRRWPGASVAYTLEFRRFLAEDLDAAQAFIEAQPEFPELRRRQTLYWEQDEQALQLRRERNQLEKIAHLLRLGRLKDTLEREGPVELQARYRRLRECESAPF